MCDYSGLSENLQAAMAYWAEENGCACIDIHSNSQLFRLWVFSVSAGVLFVTVATAPLCWWYRPRTEVEVWGIPGIDFDETEAQNKSSRTSVEDRGDVGKVDPAPNHALAKEHHKQVSCTKDGKWHSIWRTGSSELAEIGGPGTELYFRLLRNLCICFSYMAAVTCSSISFNTISNFAPDNGQPLVKTSIGNIGYRAPGIDLHPKERYIIAKSAGFCEGVPVTEVSATMAWLDFVAILVFLCFICYFRFRIIPTAAEKFDNEQITTKDYAVIIDHLPRRFEGMEEVDAEGRTKYERDLTELLCARMQHMRNRRTGITYVAPLEVKEVILGRDFKGTLDAVRRNALLRHELDVQEYIGNAAKVKKLEKKIEKTDARLSRKLSPEPELPVVCAFAIISTKADKENLITDYRFSEFFLMRLLAGCCGVMGWLECCCPQRPRLFKGKAIRIREAPEPSNVIWENQDVNWKERLVRRGVVGLVFVGILLLSLALVYTTNLAAKSNMESVSQRSGIDECDAAGPATVAENTSEAYTCLVANATAWTMDFLEQNATSDEKTCYCGSVGYFKIRDDAQLYNGICKDFLIAQLTGVVLMALCSVVVVGINVSAKTIMKILAVFEKPLSETELHSSKMTKIFALQTLNTGVVVFLLNFSMPSGFPFGESIFKGEFSEPVRGWYAIVGGAILMNMLANAFVPAAGHLGAMVGHWILRCCRRSSAKHHSQLVALYTPRDFEIAEGFAQLLMTTFVCVMYSSGLPMLNVFVAAFAFCNYWADKIVLLWGSRRPPAYDVKMAQDAAGYLLYAVALHCFFALWMFSQSCTFPSNQLGGHLKALSDQASSVDDGSVAGASSMKDRITKETTWMFFLLLVFLAALWVLWTVVWILGGTLGEFLKCVLMLCHRKSNPTDDDAAASVPWDKARVHIEKVAPPASYDMARLPKFAKSSGHMEKTKSAFSSPKASSSSLRQDSGIAHKASASDRPPVQDDEGVSPDSAIAHEAPANDSPPQQDERALDVGMEAPRE